MPDRQDSPKDGLTHPLNGSMEGAGCTGAHHPQRAALDDCEVVVVRHANLQARGIDLLSRLPAFAPEAAPKAQPPAEVVDACPFDLLGGPHLKGVIAAEPAPLCAAGGRQAHGPLKTHARGLRRGKGKRLLRGEGET